MADIFNKSDKLTESAMHGIAELMGLRLADSTEEMRKAYDKGIFESFGCIWAAADIEYALQNRIKIVSGIITDYGILLISNRISSVTAESVSLFCDGMYLTHSRYGNLYLIKEVLRLPNWVHVPAFLHQIHGDVSQTMPVTIFDCTFSDLANAVSPHQHVFDFCTVYVHPHTGYYHLVFAMNRRYERETLGITHACNQLNNPCNGYVEKFYG